MCVFVYIYDTLFFLFPLVSVRYFGLAVFCVFLHFHPLLCCLSCLRFVLWLLQCFCIHRLIGETVHFLADGILFACLNRFHPCLPPFYVLVVWNYPLYVLSLTDWSGNFLLLSPFNLYAIIKYFKSYSDIEWQFSDTVYHLTPGFMYLCLFFLVEEFLSALLEGRSIVEEFLWESLSFSLHIRMTTLELDSCILSWQFFFQYLRMSTFPGL